MTEIEVIRGDDVTLTLTFTDKNGVIIDLTNSTVFFTVKRKVSDTDANALISKTITSFAAPTTGVCTVSLTDTDTNLSSGVYYYDVQLVDATGLVSSIEKDKFVVIKDITTRIV